MYIDDEFPIPELDDSLPQIKDEDLLTTIPDGEIVFPSGLGDFELPPDVGGPTDSGCLEEVAQLAPFGKVSRKDMAKITSEFAKSGVEFPAMTQEMSIKDLEKYTGKVLKAVNTACKRQRAAGETQKTKSVTLRVPHHIVEAFKSLATGSVGYQTLMIRALRDAAEKAAS